MSRHDRGAARAVGERLETSQREADEQTRFHAEQLEILWSIANDRNLRDDALLLAMLGQAAAAIRPN